MVGRFGVFKERAENFRKDRVENCASKPKIIKALAEYAVTSEEAITPEAAAILEEIRAAMAENTMAALACKYCRKQNTCEWCIDRATREIKWSKNHQVDWEIMELLNHTQQTAGPYTVREIERDNQSKENEDEQRI